MSARDDLGAEHGLDREMTEVVLGVQEYFTDGDGSRLSLPLWGLEVFAVISALREHDEEFREGAKSDEDRARRLKEIEEAVDEAVTDNMQYFPFGHNRNKTSLPESVIGQLKANRSSWGAASKKGGSQRGSHAGEFVSGSHMVDVNHPYAKTKKPADK